MNVLVTGARGMLGVDLVSELQSRKWNVHALDIQQLNVTDAEAVARIASGTFGKLDWCFNCAAYTAVDKAESEVDSATLVNAVAPGYLARACGMAGVRLLHIGTDFVFDGQSKTPYSEDCAPNPLGTYGRTKLEGEEAVLAASGDAVIVRTAWLYGAHGSSFPRTLIQAWIGKKKLRVVADQFGAPTYTVDLARVLADIAAYNLEGGVYHAAGPNVLSWHGFAKRAIEIYASEVLQKEATIEIDPISTEEWPTPAARPKYSVLSFDKLARLGIQPMNSLDIALSSFVRELPV